MSKKERKNRDEVMLEEMINAAKELNTAFGLEPEIDIELPIDDLSEKLKEAFNLITEDDELSKETMRTLNTLCNIFSEGNDKKEGVKKEGVKKEGVKKEGVKKEGVKKEGVKKEGVKKEGKPTRAKVMANILFLSTKTPMNKKKMSDEMIKMYGGSENEAKFQVDHSTRLLKELGLLEEKDGKLALLLP